MPVTIPSMIVSETRLFASEEQDHTLYPAALKTLVMSIVVVVLPMDPVIPTMSAGTSSLTICENSSLVRTLTSLSAISFAIGASSGKVGGM